MTSYTLDIHLKTNEYVLENTVIRSEYENITIEELLKECYREIDASIDSNFVLFKRFGIILAKDNINCIKIRATQS